MPKLFLALILIGSMLLCSCTPVEEPVSTVSEESPSVRSSMPEEKNQSSSADSEAAPEATESSQAEPAAEPVSTAEQSAIENQTSIVVEPLSLLGPHETFAITDGYTQKKLLGYLSTMQLVDAVADPVTGGYVFVLRITQNNITEQYELLSDSDSNGNAYVVKDSQRYVADRALWRVVVEHFPLFDYENNQPRYVVDVTSRAKNTGMGMSYYDEGKTIWNETEQERSSRILGYMAAMTPTNAVDKSALESAEIIQVGISETGSRISQSYICYYDSNGRCFVLYEGYYDFENNGDQFQDVGQWFTVDAEFFRYMNNILD